MPMLASATKTASHSFISHSRPILAHPFRQTPAWSCTACFSKTSTRTFSTTRPTSTADRMRAVLIKDGKGPAENLYIGEEETPEPKEGEVLVKVRLASSPSVEADACGPK